MTADCKCGKEIEADTADFFMGVKCPECGTELVLDEMGDGSLEVCYEAPVKND